MNIKFINPFIDTTIEVLQTMAFTESKSGKPYLKKGKRSSGDVSGLIGLTGDKTHGSFAITFTEDCIKAVVSNMLGEDYEEICAEVLDAVGELTNMISGGARAKLSEKGYIFNMAIPSVISGKAHVIVHLTDSPIIVIPFETENGKFFIEACLKDFS